MYVCMIVFAILWCQYSSMIRNLGKKKEMKTQKYGEKGKNEQTKIRDLAQNVISVNLMQKTGDIFFIV